MYLYYAASISYLEYTGQQGTSKYDLAKLALKTNGYFWSGQEEKFPKRTPKVFIHDLINNVALLKWH